MSKGLKWRIILIVAVCIVAVYFIYPTFRVASLKNKEAPDPELLSKYQKKALHLGLDLQGGIHIILEVDKSNLQKDEAKDATERALEIIRTRVDQFGVSEPSIQPQGNNRILVQLPGVDLERARGLIGQTALLEFKLVKQPSEIKETLDRLDRFISRRNRGEEATTGEELTEKESAAEETAERDTGATEEDSLLFGEEEFPIYEKQLEEEMPFSRYLHPHPQLPNDIIVLEKNIPRIREYLSDPEIQNVLPRTTQIAWGRQLETTAKNQRFRALYFLEKKAELTGAAIADAEVDFGSGYDPARANKPYVRLTMVGSARRRWAEITGDNVQRRLAVVLDGQVESAPVIKDRIRGGVSSIEGDFTDEKAKDLAIILRAGALPAPVNIIEERSVGPSLGRDSIQLGIRAALFGFCVVLLYMIVYYKLSGIISNLALVLNIFFVFSALAGFGARLTLPGIAGIILTIGMAVDANVLIFERIREELKTGKSVRASIEYGYQRAFRTILDANLTTLITGIVLYEFGTGPIKGFAVTLCIGIVASMFTAIIVSRMIFDLIYSSGYRKTISI
jgi:protein-export membrane protein SecD